MDMIGEKVKEHVQMDVMRYTIALAEHGRIKPEEIKIYYSHAMACIATLYKTGKICLRDKE